MYMSNSCPLYTILNQRFKDVLSEDENIFKEEDGVLVGSIEERGW